MENICKYSLHNWKNCASTSVKLCTTVVPGDATSSAVPRQLCSHTRILTHWRAHAYNLENKINLKLLVQLLLYTFVFVSSSSTFTKYLTKTSKAQNVYVLAHCFRRSQPTVVTKSRESSSVKACGCTRLNQSRSSGWDSRDCGRGWGPGTAFQPVHPVLLLPAVLHFWMIPASPAGTISNGLNVQKPESTRLFHIQA